MQVHVELKGRSGLVMHNGRLADPLDPLAAGLSELTSKSKKTEEEQRAIADYEWKASLYYDKEIGPYIPAENVIRSFRDAATAWKLGERVYDFVVVLDDKVPLQHDGPSELGKLAKREENRLRKTVKIGRNRTPRTRPIFRSWGLSFDIELEEDGLNFADLTRIAERAGRLEGLGDARKLGYGRFDAHLTPA
jgi:hypothetical protein